MDKLFDVHTALNEAASEASDNEGIPISFRLPRKLKVTAGEICKANNTTISSFLRKCCEGLVRDYTGQSVSEQGRSAEQGVAVE